eukprot:37505-Pyramimonas_sp.AAC.1
MAHIDSGHASLHQLVRDVAAHVGGERHGDPRQDAVEPALLHVHAEHLRPYHNSPIRSSPRVSRARTLQSEALP